MATITCAQCEDPKPHSEFYPQYRNPGCKQPRCKLCVCENVQQNRKQKRKQYAALDKKRNKTKKRRSQRIEWQRTWRKANPIKYRARQAVSNAIRDGRLKRGPCEGCGTKRRVQAHHDDYEKPLDVRWLCFKCHRAEHEDN